MDWILTGVGLSCFWLAGRKVWWAWFVGLAGQGLWAAYAITTKQYGFLVGVAAYTVVYLDNQIKWAREHRRDKTPEVKPFEWGDIAGHTITSAQWWDGTQWRPMPVALMDGPTLPAKYGCWCPHCFEPVDHVDEHARFNGVGGSWWDCPGDEPLDESIRNRT